jgi:hypothetical protein
LPEATPVTNGVPNPGLNEYDVIVPDGVNVNVYGVSPLDCVDPGTNEYSAVGAGIPGIVICFVSCIVPDGATQEATMSYVSGDAFVFAGYVVERVTDIGVVE